MFFESLCTSLCGLGFVDEIDGQELKINRQHLSPGYKEIAQIHDSNLQQLLLRLQTILGRCVLDEEDGSLVSDEMRELIGATPNIMHVNQLCIEHDLKRRVEMLERLMIEAVRDSYPKENDRFGGVYLVLSDDTLVFAKGSFVDAFSK